MPRHYEPIRICRATQDRTCHRCDKLIPYGSIVGVYKEWITSYVDAVVFGGPRWATYRLCERCTARSKRQKITTEKRSV